MKIILSAIDLFLEEAFRHQMSKSPIDNVSIHGGCILETGAQYIVSPANSFGYMDGGIDAVYRRKWPGIEEKVVQTICEATVHHELLVGQAEKVQVQYDPFICLVVAPTMRVPGPLESWSANPFLATRAALFETGVAPDSWSIAIPGMGSGVGGMDHNVVARQMFDAIQEYNARVDDTGWALRHKKERLLELNRDNLKIHPVPIQEQNRQ